MDLDGSSQRRLTYEFNVASAAVQFKLPLKDTRYTLVPRYFGLAASNFMFCFNLFFLPGRAESCDA